MLENRNVLAWFLFVSAVAVHVMDEALTGFLPFWNQLVTNLRKDLSFLPLPTFTFVAWIGGLLSGVLIGYAMIPAVNRDGKFMRWLTLVLGILMLANATGHLLGSLYFGRILPGFWSSPFLLLASLFVIVRSLKGKWGTRVDQTKAARTD